MNNLENALRLGPLPRSTTVKLTLNLPVELKEKLDRYAAVHGQLHQEAVDATTLIPHMLNAFMTRDRAFRQWERRAPDRASSPPEPDE